MSRVGPLLFHVGLLAALAPTLENCSKYTTADPDDAGDRNRITDPRDGSVESGSVGDGGVKGEVGVAVCDPAERPPANAIYVAPLTDLERPPEDGTALAPFSQLGAAVAAAVGRGGAPLLLAAGTYTESLVLDAVLDYSMQGAWVRNGSAWSRDCAAGYEQRTQIVSRTEVGLTVVNATRLLLRNLTLRSEPNTALGPVSRYGLFATGTNVTLDNVRVFAAAGAAGAPGNAGAAGPPPACTTTADCLAAPAAGTTPPAADSAPSSGSFAPNGYVPRDGAAGEQAGGSGSAGSPGSAGKEESFCANGATCIPSDCDPLSGPVRGEAGLCGCGGVGGAAGSAGGGGGASVGVFVVGKGVEFINSIVTAAVGGDGAAGGMGGAGSPGAAGAAGAATECWSVQCCWCGSPDNCYGGNDWNGCCGGEAPTKTMAAGGAAGGNGAAGGSGQTGGAGAGGPSYAVVLHSQARLIDNRSQYVFGRGGTAPAGGASGPSGPELIVP